MAVEEAKDSIEAMPEYPPEIIDEAVERIQAQGLYSESGHEFGKDTFNPSTLFNDKTHAEWTGNLLANKESDTMKNLSVQPPKPSKFMFIMVGLVGFLIGIMFVIFLSGGFGLGGTSPHTTTTPYVPPLPSSSSNPIVRAGLAVLGVFN